MSASEGIRRVAYWFDVSAARQKMLNANMTADNASGYADARMRSLVELERYIDARIDAKLNAAIRVQDSTLKEENLKTGALKEQQ